MSVAQPLGAILTILAILLYACDRGNRLVLWVGGAGLALLLGCFVTLRL
jgi:hypothetical protein